MILLAVIFPTISFLLRGKLISAIVCLILQITLIGWLPASIWAVVSLNNSRAEERNKKLIEAIKTNRSNTTIINN